MNGADVAATSPGRLQSFNVIPVIQLYDAK